MIQSYFEKLEEQIVSSISSANKHIKVAVAWFTNQVILDCLIEALKRNAEVKIIILNDLLNRSEFGLDYGYLANHGADIRFASLNGGTMHHKFCIIDNKIITGSYNWTYHANKNNENIIITDELSVVSKYNDQFEKLFNECTPISLPYKHLKWPEVKDDNFFEHRRNILLDISAKNGLHKEIRMEKLNRLNSAYKSGDVQKIEDASRLPISENVTTIMDVLIRQHKSFSSKIFEMNIFGSALLDPRYSALEKWIYTPYRIERNKNHEEYIIGYLRLYKWYKKRSFPYEPKELKIYDSQFISSLQRFRVGNEFRVKEIPEELLCIEYAKMYFYKFPMTLYGNDDIDNIAGKATSSINVFGIAKEVEGDSVVFYEGWDPQKRGEIIQKECFHCP